MELTGVAVHRCTKNDLKKLRKNLPNFNISMISTKCPVLIIRCLVKAQFPQDFRQFTGTTIIFSQNNIVGLKPGSPLEIWCIFTER